MTQSPNLYLSVYNRSYHHSACKAYNMVRHVVDTLRLDDTVFATAMGYWHSFASVHGYRQLNEVVLAAACVFLAGKVEHYKLRADQVLRVVFDLGDHTTKEEADDWRRALLETELILSDALDFDFQREQPIQQVLSCIEKPFGKLSTEPGEEKAIMLALQRAAHCIYILSLLTPLCMRATPRDIAATITYLTAHYSGQEKAYEYVWLEPPQLDSIERDGIASVLLDVFAYTRKESGLPPFDELVKARRKRLRKDSSEETASLIQNSGLTCTSAEGSPVARSTE